MNNLHNPISQPPQADEHVGNKKVISTGAGLLLKMAEDYNHRTDAVGRNLEVMSFYDNSFAVNPKIPNNIKYPTSTMNLMHRAINTASAFVSSRLGEIYVSSPHVDGDEQAAELLNRALQDADRLTGAMSKARGGIVDFLTAGEFILRFDYASNINQSRFQAKQVHLSDFFCDPISKEPDLSDAIWVAERAWVPREEASLFIEREGYNYNDMGVAIEKITPKEARDISDVGLGDNQNGFWFSNEYYQDAKKLRDTYTQLEGQNVLLDTVTRKMHLESSREYVAHWKTYHWENQNIQYIEADGARIQYNPNIGLHRDLAYRHGLKEMSGRRSIASHYIGGKLVRRRPSPYGDSILAPYVRFVYRFNAKTNQPYGAGLIMADYQKSLTRIMQKAEFESTQKRLFIDSGAVESDSPESILRLGIEAVRPGGVVLLTPKPGQRVSDVIVESGVQGDQSLYAWLNVMREEFQGHAPPVTQGEIGSLRSGTAIDQATQNASGPWEYAVMRYKDGILALGRLMLNNVLLGEFSDGNLARQITDPLTGERKVYSFNDPELPLTNILSAARMKVSLQSGPPTQSERDAGHQQLGDILSRFGDPNALALYIRTHPYLPAAVKKAYFESASQPSAEQELDNEKTKAEIAERKAKTNKLNEQTLSEPSNRAAKMAKIKQGEDEKLLAAAEAVGQDVAALGL